MGMHTEGCMVSPGSSAWKNAPICWMWYYSWRDKLGWRHRCFWIQHLSPTINLNYSSSQVLHAPAISSTSLNLLHFLLSPKPARNSFSSNYIFQGCLYAPLFPPWKTTATHLVAAKLAPTIAVPRPSMTQPLSLRSQTCPQTPHNGSLTLADTIAPCVCQTHKIIGVMQEKAARWVSSCSLRCLWHCDPIHGHILPGDLGSLSATHRFKLQP